MPYDATLHRRLGRALLSARGRVGHGALAMTFLFLVECIGRAVAQSGVFADRAALLAARDAWCADPAAAAATYGLINQWDVSQVQDLSYMFCGMSAALWQQRGCKPTCSTFNEDIDGWDVSRVTSLVVRMHPAACRARRSSGVEEEGQVARPCPLTRCACARSISSTCSEDLRKRFSLQ